MARALKLVAVGIVFAAACRTPASGGAHGSPSASASASAARTASSAGAPIHSAAATANVSLAVRLRDIQLAEYRRDSRAISADDLSHRELRVRRAAARALARIADSRARDALKKSLADEDVEVVAFSAYGLGYACRDAEAELVRMLTMRQASLLADATFGSRPAQYDAVFALFDALGRCGTADAERTLRAGLNAKSPVSESAALALGQIASRKGKLDDASLVALLDAASRPSQPLENALFAFTRLSSLSAPVQARLLDVCKQSLTASGVRRAFALRALVAVGDVAAPLLGEAVKNAKLTLAERAEAARSLTRLGSFGQKALQDALRALPTTEVPATNFGVQSAVLDALRPPLGDVSTELGKFAELPVPDAQPARRRAIALRCRAAALLAGRATLSPRLRACDPDAEGRSGQLAAIFVLDQGKLAGPRYQRFKELTQAKDAVVRQQALRLLGGHPEAQGAAELLAQALRAKSAGDIATGAEVLARYPERAGADPAAGKDSLTPAPDLIAALSAAFDASQGGYDLETRGALIDAAAALQLLGFKSRIEKSCSSDLPSLRDHAEKALRLLGDRQRTCNDFTPAAAAPDEAAHLLEGSVLVELDTEAGLLELRLDATLAPLAVTRVVELARQGFYDGMAVHRVVPGFVVQFGDRAGDGFGGAGRPPLRCETAPRQFGPLQVGVALGGRDTGSSQLFVTLGRFPHLDGEYTVLGNAEGAWDNVSEGDVIRKVRVNPGG